MIEYIMIRNGNKITLIWSDGSNSELVGEFDSVTLVRRHCLANGHPLPRWATADEIN